MDAIDPTPAPIVLAHEPSVPASEAIHVSSAPRRLPCYAEIFIVILLAIAPTIVGWLPGRIFVPADGSPGSDAVAMTSFAARTMGNKDIPLWDSATPMGQPMIGIGRSAVFFPTTFLHLFLPPKWSWILVVDLKLLAGALGMWMLARRGGLSHPGRLMAVGAFVLSGLFLLSPHDALANVAAVAPWLLLAIDRLLRTISPARIAITALCIALAIFGGDPPAILSLASLVIAFALVRIVRSNRAEIIGGKPVWQMLALIGALLVGMTIAAIQLEPTAEFAKYLAGNSASAAVDWNAMPLRTIWTSESKASPCWVGAITLFLAAWAIVFGRRRDAIERDTLDRDTLNRDALNRRAGGRDAIGQCRGVLGWLFTGFCTIAILVAFAMIAIKTGDAEARFLLSPGLLLGPMLVIAILAGKGLDAIAADLPSQLLPQPRASARDPSSLPNLLRAAAITLAILAIIAAGAGIILRAKYPAILADAITLAVAAVTFYLPVLLIRAKYPREWSILAVALAAPIILSIIYLPTIRRTQPLPMMSTTDFNDGTVADAIGPIIVHRQGLNIIGQSPLVWIVPRSQYFRDRQAALEAVRAGADALPIDSVIVDPQVQSATNATDDPIGRPGFDGKDPNWFKQTATALQDNTAVAGAVGGDKVCVFVTSNAWIVVATRLYPGWRAEVSLEDAARRTASVYDTPIIPAYGTMQALFVPDRADLATFVYDPPGWRWSAFASIAGVLLLLILLGCGILSENVDHHPNDPAAKGAADDRMLRAAV
jgi:hypothetical protein